MAQDAGDPIIANGAESLSVSRPKIVAAVEALRTLHSGTAAPAVTVNHQLWGDTTTSIVKQRNPANNAWRNLWRAGAGPFANIPYAKTASFTVDQPGVYYCDAASGAITATLPSAAASAGWFIMVVRTNSGANAVTVQRAGSDTIEGATSLTLSSQYSKAAVFGDGGTVWMKWGGF